MGVQNLRLARILSTPAFVLWGHVARKHEKDATRKSKKEVGMLRNRMRRLVAAVVLLLMMVAPQVANAAPKQVTLDVSYEENALWVLIKDGNQVLDQTSYRLSVEGKSVTIVAKGPTGLVVDVQDAWRGKTVTIKAVARDKTAYADATTTIRIPEMVVNDMYRLYNPNSGEHFYTANKAELSNVLAAGWRYEGVGWHAPTTSKTPVYRLYNPNAGDHHYTMNAAERNMLVIKGWRYEGIGWYSDDNQTVALYRQYNPNARTGTHNYTINKAENDWLVSLGWRAEGIGWYGA